MSYKQFNFRLSNARSLQFEKVFNWISTLDRFEFLSHSFNTKSLTNTRTSFVKLLFEVVIDTLLIDYENESIISEISNQFKSNNNLIEIKQSLHDKYEFSDAIALQFIALGYQNFLDTNSTSQISSKDHLRLDRLTLKYNLRSEVLSDIEDSIK